MFLQIAHYSSKKTIIYDDDNDNDDNDNGGNIVIVIIIMMMIIIMIMIIIYYDNIGTIPWISMDQMFHRNAFGKNTHTHKMVPVIHELRKKHTWMVSMSALDGVPTVCTLKQCWKTCQSRTEKFGLHQATATRILAHNQMRGSQKRQLPSHLRSSKLEMKFQTISHIKMKFLA